jgi:hypothetical protein
VSNFKKTIRSLQRIIQSNKFFYFGLIIFTLGCVWVATASLYPMAFDEEFHLGLIKIYATSWLPYGIHHTADMAQYGAATADPSYLFHYVMSFPYRLLNFAGLSEQAIIIVLRLINVGLVAIALVVFRKSFLRAGLGRTTTNLSLILFMFIPVLSMLAGQINYDNLLLLIVAGGVWLSVIISNAVKKDGRLPAAATWLLIILILFGAAVKYAFLPIGVGFLLWIVVLIYANTTRFKHSVHSQLRSFLKATNALSAKIKLGLIVCGALGLFFGAHYVTNIVSYGSPIPPCDQVFDENLCTAYGPWNRDNNYVKNRNTSFKPMSLPAYMVVEWLPGMTNRLTFALAGKTNGFQTKLPLPITLIVFVAVAIIGLLALIWQLTRRPSKTPYFVWFSVLLCVCYVGVLISQLYGEYVKTAQPAAINGRYLLPLLPMLGASMIYAIASMVWNIPRTTQLLVVFAVLLLLLIGGGGVETYILQSEPKWFWPGWGQTSQDILQHVFRVFTVAWRLQF